MKGDFDAGTSAALRSQTTVNEATMRPEESTPH